ncbi:MAG: hypothetical protein JXL82_01350, partial [Candidatus Omnitrophica bacterium]|nr:hypothetical protein [Candidatus Omnitrophota bacterium]
MKIVAVLIISFFSLSPFALAEELPLTLEEALVIGLRDNRNILLGEEELKKAKAKIAESHADLFPSLSFSGSWTYTTDLRKSNRKYITPASMAIPKPGCKTKG